MVEMIADFISGVEYRCRHCSALPPDYKSDDPPYCYQVLFDDFKAIREAWGKSIVISSGYRCPVHNVAVGGESISVHVFGLALDLTVDRKDVDEFMALARAVAPDLRKGWAKYITLHTPIVHIDVGYLIWPRPSAAFKEGVEW
jgi:uncharacterized protein YcbK (DUF882 family)